MPNRKYSVNCVCIK